MEGERGITEKRTDLFGDGIVYCRNETVYFVAHGLGSNTSGGGLEVDMTCTANTSIEGLATRHQGRRHAIGLDR